MKKIEKDTDEWSLTADQGCECLAACDGTVDWRLGRREEERKRGRNEWERGDGEGGRERGGGRREGAGNRWVGGERG